MLDTKTDLEKLTESMLASFAGLSDLKGTDEMKIGDEGARQIAVRGKPTTSAAIAKSLDLPQKRVENILQSFADDGFVFLDDNKAVLGIFGITAPGTALPEMSHKITLDQPDAPTVSAWCALDTLYFAYMFDVPVRVRSVCAVTKQEISFTVKPDGTAEHVTPEGAVLSALIPDGPITKDVRVNFCHYVNFFADEKIGKQWADAQDVTVKLLSVAEAAQWTKQHYSKLFG